MSRAGRAGPASSRAGPPGPRGTVTAVYLASLLAHELAHSLVARRYGVTVKSITLWLLGGISELGGETPGPAAEARSPPPAR
jgi:Zn-dependent protease